MLSRIEWKREPFFLVVAGLMLSLSLGTLFAAALKRIVPIGSVEESFLVFVVSSLSFQGAAILLAHFFLRQHGVRWGDFLGLNDPRARQHALLGLGVGLLVVPGLLLLNKLCYEALKAAGLDPVQQLTVQLAQDTAGLVRRACFGFAAIVIAPLGEEILFRGLLYRFIRQRGHAWLAIWITSLLFAGIHGNLMTFVPLLVFALVQVWLVERTDTLLAPLVTHAFFNAMNFLLLILEPQLKQVLERSA